MQFFGGKRRTLMPTILVVDDSPLDRRLVGELLAKDADVQVRYAVHGADALATMAQSLPDVVVTDLLMPELDGLGLVAAVRKLYPLVPVILMTSQGSEEIAVHALQQGAASYVSKRLLPQYLGDTIQKVLSVSLRDRSYFRLMGCIQRTESTFLLENDPALFGPLIMYLQEGASQIGVCDEADRVRVGIALEETLANALYHGNLEVSSELRESDTDAYYEMAEKRRHQSPYQERRIVVQAKLACHEAVFVVRDEGSGFDVSALPDPTDPSNLEKVSGRGIFLMRSFMDQVFYNAAGNVVTLIKRNGAEGRSNG
jgi:CheY-like chemotaxis protein